MIKIKIYSAVDTLNWRDTQYYHEYLDESVAIIGFLIQNRIVDELYVFFEMIG